jgi:tetratricopeptide (TPR) repeat protein
MEQAYNLSRGVADKAVRAEASCNFAAVLVRDMDLDRAESLYQEGLRELPDAAQFALERVDCLQTGLEVAQENGKIQEGISRAEDAQRVLRASPFDSDALELHRWSDLGKAYSSAGQDGKAVIAYEKAAAIVSSLGRDDTRTAATLYNNWAIELVQVGRPLEAERLYRRAIDITKVSESENDVSPIVLHNFAISLRELGRIQEAADNEDLSYRLSQKVGGQGMEGRIMLERARIYTAQHNPAQASVLLAQVEEKFHKDLPAGHFAFAVLAGAQSLNELEKGDVAAAMKHADEAVSIDEAAIKSGGEGSYYLPTLLTNRATVELAGHHPDTAASDASRAVSLWKAGMEPGMFSNKVGRAYLILGHALQEQGKSDEARAAFRSAAENLQTTLGTDHPDYREARQLAGLEVANK